MTTRCGLFFLALAASALGGCRSHSIREGIWELSFNAQDHLSKEPQPIPARRVRVAVGWSRRPENPGGEEVELEMLAESPEDDPLRIYGDIPEEGRKLTIGRATDPYWVFHMVGNILTPERVVGTYFLARHRYEEHTAFEGRWEMRWLED